MIHVHIRDDEHRPTLDQARLKDTVAALKAETAPGRAALHRRLGARPAGRPAGGAGRGPGLVQPDDGHHQLR